MHRLPRGGSKHLVEAHEMLLVTPSQMEQIDAETIQERGLPSLVLMENAARAVLPHVPPGPVTVLVGPGNNGGDGLVLARALHEAGRRVSAWLFSDRLSPDAEQQRALAQEWGVPLEELFHLDSELPPLDAGGVIVDALFGTGLKRAPRDLYARALEKANQTEAYRLAIDMPSGVDGATGQILGTAFTAHRTVTFGLAKWGQMLYPGKERCGELVLVQPGFHPEALERHSKVRLVGLESLSGLIPHQWPTMHKGDNGRILLATGSITYPGAGLLSVLGALRGGGGLVTLACPAELRTAITARTPEALILDREDLDDLSAFNALVLGCGLGTDTDTIAPDLLSRFEGPAVVDADALRCVTRFSREKRAGWVLTPHPGELSKLLGRPVAELEKNRIENAQQAAHELGSIVCFKGSPTVCASPDGRAYVNTSGNAILAQGGSGDVLAGLMGAYLGFGLPPLEAAAGAVFIHGLAADLLSQERGSKGAGAAALAERIPQALAYAVGKQRLSGVM